MKKISNNVYINFEYEQLPQQQKNNVLILGYAGQGKKCLWNNLCQNNNNKNNLTNQQVYDGQCSFISNNALQISVYPGTGIEIIQGSLQQQKWNLIITVNKLEAQNMNKTLESIKKFIKFISAMSQNQDLPLIVVSHVDTVGTSQNEREEFLNQFGNSLKKNQINNNIIVFSNIDSDFRVLSKLIYFCTLRKHSNMQKQAEKINQQQSVSNYFTAPQKQKKQLRSPLLASPYLMQNKQHTSPYFQQNQQPMKMQVHPNLYIKQSDKKNKKDSKSLHDNPSSVRKHNYNCQCQQCLGTLCCCLDLGCNCFIILLSFLSNSQRR